jgi:hypothetical protein
VQLTDAVQAGGPVQRGDPHVIEQQAANALIRPLAGYTGAAERAVPVAANRLVG